MKTREMRTAIHVDCCEMSGRRSSFYFKSGLYFQVMTDLQMFARTEDTPPNLETQEQIGFRFVMSARF